MLTLYLMLVLILWDLPYNASVGELRLLNTDVMAGFRLHQGGPAPCRVPPACNKQDTQRQGQLAGRHLRQAKDFGSAPEWDGEFKVHSC